MGSRREPILRIASPASAIRPETPARESSLPS